MYECIIVGGGIAGLQAAIQLGRYKRHVLVIDSNHGRSNLCKSYHNILGWPEGVSGETLRALGKAHAEQYGIQFQEDVVISCVKEGEQVIVTTESGQTFSGKTLLLATGVMDCLPNLANLKPCLGVSIYVCPDCDGYEVMERSVIVLGRGEVGANLSLTLTYWTNRITYIDEAAKELKNEMKQKLMKQNIHYIRGEAAQLLVESEGVFKGIQLNTGDTFYAERCFLGLGGNKVHSELAKQLGIHTMENHHAINDLKTKESNIKHIWVAGDLVAHSEQVTVAMGEGVQAAIWIHKRLLEI
ncbi:NAD(P)/FAD-dependent oxidoreductase [Priestia megaterium]|nr:NAD(P)/FAD-dependent oxidoreductase [Priestia megaterium]